MSDLTVAEWKMRLESTFLAPSGELSALQLEEAEAAEELSSKLRGHYALMDSFHEFFLRTLRRALTLNKKGAAPPEEWWMVFLEFLTAFRTWRAAELTFRTGYPLSGYVLLRDLKDRALVLSAVARGISTLRKVHAYESLDHSAEKVSEEMKKLRKREEWRIRREVVGKESGMSASSVTALRTWAEMFHTQVHGARLSLTDYLPWLKGEQPLTFGPQIREPSASAYTNRAAEVGWLWTRLFPVLQTGQGFGTTWGSEWRVLDESFRYMVVTLKELQKPALDELVDAICELVSKKFAFGTETRFPSS